jgi:hypothetical protein
MVFRCERQELIEEQRVSTWVGMKVVRPEREPVPRLAGVQLT